MKILGRCEQCGEEREVEIKCFPYFTNLLRVMVEVTAKCVECGSMVDATWAGLSELKPDDAEFEKAREALGI